MWRIKTTKDGVWLGSWILHSATQFHPFSTLPWDDQYPLHHRAIDQSLREGKNSDRAVFEAHYCSYRRDRSSEQRALDQEPDHRNGRQAFGSWRAAARSGRATA